MAHQHFVISRADAGRPLRAVLRGRLSLTREQADRALREGRVRLGGRVCTNGAWRVQRGQRVRVRSGKPKAAATRRQLPAESEPSRRRLPPSAIRFVDEYVVVVDKPAGLTTMRHPEEAAEFGQRGQRFLPATLADLLPELLPPSRRGKRSPVRAVHRLDKETSGLVVFARTPEAEGHLGKQFRAHTVERTYLALVRGRPREGRIESYLVPDRGDGRRGSTAQPGEGKPAVTHVRVVESLGEFTLVECRLETGRTHQVRIHLGEAGTPLCGERVYDRPLHGKPLPDTSGARRVMLHAATLGFAHPATGKRMAWKSPPSEDMAELIRRLRGERPA